MSFVGVAEGIERSIEDSWDCDERTNVRRNIYHKKGQKRTKKERPGGYYYYYHSDGRTSERAKRKRAVSGWRDATKGREGEERERGGLSELIVGCRLVGVVGECTGYDTVLRYVLYCAVQYLEVVSRLDSPLPVGRSDNPVFFLQTATIRPLPFPICVLCIAYVEHLGIHNE